MTTSLSDQGLQFANGSVQPSAAAPQIAPISAQLISNTITVTLAPCALAFRKTTLTDGVPDYLNNTGTLTLTIAATDSFGLTTVFGSQRIVILAINNAGTIELAASTLYGGVSLDETGVITTAATSTTATGIKAAAVRTGVAYRVVGFVGATFTTAVGWGSMVLVQGVGGQALAAMSSLGYGQTWQNVTGSRVLGTTYYNTTGRPIAVCGYLSNNATDAIIFGSVNGANLVGNGFSIAGMNNGNPLGVTIIVPPSASYALSGSGGTLTSWRELR